MSNNRKEILSKLELVELAVNHSSFIPEFRNFHFNKGVLAASDGITSIFTKSPIPEETFSVKADSFLNLLRNIDSEEITLKIKDDSLSVRTKRLEGKFNIGKPGDYNLNIPEDSKNLNTCKDLLEGIYLCRFGVCKEKTSGSISGVRIEGNKIYSTDRFRVHQYKLGVATAIPSCTIPTKFVEIIHKLKDRIVQYGLLENIFYVVLEDGSLVETVVFSDDYPELEQYFENLDMSGFTELKFKEDLSSILDKHLESFLGNVDFYDKEIKFAIAEKICILYSGSKSGGNLLEEIELEEDIGEYEFIVNPTLLQEVLQYGKGKFLYHLEDKIILLDADKLQILIQTKI